MLWDGSGTEIPLGDEVKSSSYSYTIKKVAGEGATNSFIAERNDGKEVFLKHYTYPNERNKEFEPFVKAQYAMFQRLKKLGNIVEENLEFFEYKGFHFQVKKLLEGESLDKLIWSKTSSLSKSFISRLNLASVIVGGLALLHDNKIVHTDLKPEQLFMTEDKNLTLGWKLTIADFDHSLIVDENLGTPATTPLYSSPEHILKQKITYKSDVFTSAIIVFLLITKGFYPHQQAISDNNIEYDDAILDINNVSNLKDINPVYAKLPKELNTVLKKCLDPKPDNRPTMKEFKEELFKIKKLCEPGAKTSSRSLIDGFNLQLGNKKILIDKDIEITRKLCKEKFDAYKDIFTRQFKIIKDSKNQWFIKHLSVPDKAKDKQGKEIKFYITKLNGKNLDYKPTKIAPDDVISVGTLEFKVVEL